MAQNAIPDGDPPGSTPGIAFSQEKDCYRWTLPGGLEVELQSAVIRQLSRDLSILRSSGHAGEEVGGLMLGAVSTTETRRVRITMLDSYSAEELTSVLRLVLTRLSDRTSPAAGSAETVGWYRLDDSGRSLRPADESLIRAHFPDSNSILLVLRQKPTVAGRFVFWTADSLRSEEIQFPAFEVVKARSRHEGDLPDRPRGWTRHRRWVGRLIVSIGIAGAGYWYWRGVKPPEPVVPVETKRQPSGPPELNMIAVFEGNLVRISWEAQSLEVLSAVSGEVAIRDGSKDVRTPLDAVRMAAGLFWYSPLTRNVTVTLNLLLQDGRRVQRSAAVVFPVAAPSR